MYSTAGKVSVDVVEKPFECSECDLKFTTKAARNIHSKTHKGNEVFTCKECSFMTNDYKIFRKHRLDECRNKIHVCHKCSKSFSSLHKLTNHMRSHLNFNLFCKHCSFKTTNPGSLHRHIYDFHRSVHWYFQSRIFSCEACEYKCASKDGIQKHISEKHSNDIDSDPPLIDIANEKDDDQLVPSPDVTVQDDTLTFACPLCDYVASNAGNIEIHVQEAHSSELSEEINKTLKPVDDEEDVKRGPLNDIPSDVFACPFCDHIDPNAIKIEIHIREEHGVNMPYPCKNIDYEINDYVTIEANTAQKQKSDIDSDFLSCTKCQFVSESPDELETHIYDVHTSSKCKSNYNEIKEKPNAEILGYSKMVNSHLYSTKQIQGQRVCIKTGLTKSNPETSGYSKVIESQIYLQSGKRKYTRKHEMSTYIEAYNKIYEDRLQADVLEKNKRITEIDFKKYEYYIKGYKLRLQINKSEFDKDNHKEWIQEMYKKIGLNWNCDVCNENFKNECGLKHHKSVKHKPNSLECTECEAFFKTRQGLVKHIARVHMANQVISCPECDFKCKNEREIWNHIPVHLLEFDNIRYQSVYIDNTETVKDPLSTHILKKYDPENIHYQNYNNDTTYDIQPSLVENEVGNENEHIYRNPTSETSIVDYYQENLDEDDEMMEEEFACPLCNYLDPDPKKIENHLQRYHASELIAENNQNIADETHGTIKVEQNQEV